MADKKVIDIDLRAESFDAFFEKFKAFDEILRQHDDIYRRLNAAMGENANVGRVGENAAMPFDDDKKWARVNQHSSKFTKFLQGSVRESAQLAKNIFGVTTGLLKWGAIGAGAGIFGATSLVHGMSDARKQSLGYGATIGEKKAAEVVYNRFYKDVNGTLSKIDQLRNNSKSYILREATGMGLDQIANTSNYDLLQKILEKMHSRKDISLTSGSGGNVFSGRDLDQLLSWEEFRLMQGMTDKEIADAGTSAPIERERQNTPDNTAKVMQDFEQMWTTLGNTIDATFTKRLKDAEPLLKRLNATLLEFVGTVDESLGRFLKSDLVQKFFNSDVSEEELWRQQVDPGYKRETLFGRMFNDSEGNAPWTGWFDEENEDKQVLSPFFHPKKHSGFKFPGGLSLTPGGFKHHSWRDGNITKPIGEWLEESWEWIKKDSTLDSLTPNIAPRSGSPEYDKQTHKPLQKINFKHDIKSRVDITVNNQTGSDINVIANAMRYA
jgi:hypothetical protein